ncbi:MAG: hypothetical protein GX288_01935 [Clostridiales bacterium]|nr:hypothetical protein [Clostridiales bacterium]
MKTNRLTDATKIFILVGTVIVVCVLCAVGFKMVNEGKSSVNANSNTLNNMSSQYMDIDLSLYNGSLVAGSELASLINTAIANDQYLAIEVITLDKAHITYNYAYIVNGEEKGLKDKGIEGQVPKKVVSTDKREHGYINPMAMFLGTTYEDSNKSIVCIKFEQQP